MKIAEELALMPDYAVKNVRGLKSLRRELGLRAIRVSEATGVDASRLTSYERYGSLPLRRNYNKLAKFFDWEEWN